MNNHKYYVYILFNKRNGTLYTGVTRDIIQRTLEHKNKKPFGFAEKYNANKLGYFEEYQYVDDAIFRKKQIKAGPRSKKLQLIESVNPNWNDLWNNIENLIKW